MTFLANFFMHCHNLEIMSLEVVDNLIIILLSASRFFSLVSIYSY